MSNKNIVTKEIPFHEDKLLGVKTEDGKVWLAVHKTCLGIGLTEDQAKKQGKNIKNSLLFKDCWTVLGAKLDTQVRKTLVIHEDMVPMWLAQIRLTPKMEKENPEATKKLLSYQLEAAKVLHSAFYQSNEQKEKLHSELGLEGQIIKMTEELSEMKSELHDQSSYLQNVMKNMTLSTAQQGKILQAGKDRINYLLGGAHSKEYKENARKCFINLWNGLKAMFECGSYKDLNPVHYNDAVCYINEWEYEE